MAGMEEPIASPATFYIADDSDWMGPREKRPSTVAHSLPLIREESARHDPNERRSRLWGNLSLNQSLIWYFAVSLLFSLFYCLFIYYVLIRKNPQIGSVLLDATTSNLLISIFSQIFVLLAEALVSNFLDTLRGALAGREAGTTATAFFGISAATGWLSVFRLVLVSRFRDLWCNFRLTLPVLGLLFSSVLKFQANFGYYFIPSKVSIPVYAGLVPIEILLLQNIRTTDLWIYFQSFTNLLLGHPNYSVPFSANGCTGSCKSFLLPGGLEMARQVAPALNLTLFHGGIFDNNEAIRVEASRGIVLSFEKTSPDFMFDWEEECIYAGEQIDDGVQLCVQQSGDSVIAGWTSCTQEIWDRNNDTYSTACWDDLSWTRKPMEWTTKMTGHYHYATATYDRLNGSLIDVQPIAPPPSANQTLLASPIPLSAPDYRTLYRKLLVPVNGSSNALERTKIDSFTYDLIWLHRTYQVSFPDQEDAPLSYLQNFLAVPIQFGIVAMEFANYTQNPELLKAFFGPQGLPLPDDMITVAVGGRSTSRLLIQEWTGWAFIAGTVAMLLLAGGGIWWLLSRPTPVLGSSGIPELDILRAGGWDGPDSHGQQRRGSGGGQGFTDRRGDGRMVVHLPEGVAALTRRETTSGWRMASSLRDWGIVAVNQGRDEGPTLVAVQKVKGKKSTRDVHVP